MHPRITGTLIGTMVIATFVTGVIVFAALVAPRAAVFWLITTPLALTVLITVVYSYLLLARKRNGKI